MHALNLTNVQALAAIDHQTQELMRTQGHLRAFDELLSEWIAPHTVELAKEQVHKLTIRVKNTLSLPDSETKLAHIKQEMDTVIKIGIYLSEDYRRTRELEDTSDPQRPDFLKRTVIYRDHCRNVAKYMLYLRRVLLRLSEIAQQLEKGGSDNVIQ